MEVTTRDEMLDVIRACLPQLGELEAAYIRDCCFREPCVLLAVIRPSAGKNSTSIGDTV
jgi:hypothetical protein